MTDRTDLPTREEAQAYRDQVGPSGIFHMRQCLRAYADGTLKTHQEWLAEMRTNIHPEAILGAMKADWANNTQDDIEAMLRAALEAWQ